MSEHIVLTVNGQGYEADVEARMLLSDFLRHDLGLSGTHVGCEHGVCGCCTVIVDGVAVRSCLMFAVQAAGHAVRTIEGLASADEELNPLQQAFRDNHALQCGFCTAGFLMTITAYLEETGNATPSPQEAREAIAGNLCRCTGYQNIVDAVRQAALVMYGEGPQ
jgi:aerobic carbon-monoxide dehydrogenase small subunit